MSEKNDHKNISEILGEMKEFLSLMKSQKKNVTKAFIYSVIFAISMLIFPITMKLIFDTLEIINTQPQEVQLVGFFIASAFTLTLLQAYVSILKNNHYFITSIIELENFWPESAHKKFLSLSLAYHERENTGVKLAKIQKGVDRLVNMFMRAFTSIIPNLIFIIFNLIVLLVLNWQLGLLFVAMFVPIVYFEYKIWKETTENWEHYEVHKEASQGIMHRGIINAQTVQHYAQEEREIAEFQKERQKMRDIDHGNHVIIHKYQFISQVLVDTLFYGTFAYSVLLVFQGNISQGTIVYIITQAGFTISLVREFLDALRYYVRNFYAVDRMKQLLEEPIDIVNKHDGMLPQKRTDILEMHNVNFEYKEGIPVLKDFTFTFNPGRMVALVGHSGCGKSTIIKLLTRMYDTTEGEITIDGCSHKEVDLFWYRKQFAIVPQTVDIFEVSLRDNIVYAYPEASETLVIEALHAAHLYDDVMNTEKFPDGLDTLIGERGVNLSGGEKQRVGIARAFIALKTGARFLVLDEATSALDTRSEREIQAIISKLHKVHNFTIIAIAHRLSTIYEADDIIVMENGEISEIGSHERLLKRNGLYSQFVAMQQTGELL